MRINEYVPVNGKFFDRGLKEEQYRPLATRRPRLTLKHVNKLRKIRQMRRLEKLQHASDIIEIYKTPEDHGDKKKNRHKKGG